MGPPKWFSGKESACNSGDAGSIPGWGRFPGEGKWQPTPVLLPGKFHGWKSLVGYSPWGRKELDMTEQLSLTLCTISYSCVCVLQFVFNFYIF